MFFKKNDKKRHVEKAETFDAVSRSQAVIEFKPDGTILAANENFLGAMGYALEEIQGKHHRIFVDPKYAQMPEYREFWLKLAEGNFDAAEYKRFDKNGKEIWIQASYNPVKDAHGITYKVIKFATDITAEKLKSAETAGQMSAVDKAQAVIQFNLDGTIITANENFLGAVGYSMDEIKGQHHRMFVEAAYGMSTEYAQFWNNLNQGKHQAAQYKRFGKGGREIWIEASYNPIFDMNGKPFKVVKYATDITGQRMVLNDVLNNLEVIDGEIRVADSQAENTAQIAKKTTLDVQAVASGTEEMSASVQEISSSMTQSMNAVQEAMKQINAADEATKRLDTAAISMGGIVNVIHDIAGQINLLALNAAIEAARAGEAGKGFAVVAGEVKSLAKQAAEATEQITKEIGATQAVSSEVVKSLTEIKGRVETVETYVSGTASAVEEQTAVTREISANMQSTSDSVASIANNMGEIAAAVQRATATVSNTKQVAQKLAK